MSATKINTDALGAIYEQVEPDESPQNLADILDEIVATIRQFVIIGDEEVTALAVWVKALWVGDVSCCE
jgi:hypothetical protein